MDILLEFNPKKHVLGVLCLRGHDWNGTGNSIRYLNRPDCCVACGRERSKRQREKDPEWCKAYNAQWRKDNADKKRESDKRYREENSEKVKALKLKYQRENRDGANRRNKKYYSSERGKLAKIRNRTSEKAKLSYRVNSHKRRVRKKSNHHFRYSSEQISNLFEEFHNRCAYCGRTEKLHLDHFIPISSGGPDCMGNLIPACKDCNFSKNRANPLSWYKSQPFYSVKRWRKILKVLGKNESNYTQLPLL
jgi:hypothetical protein